MNVPDGCVAQTPAHLLFSNFDVVTHQSIVHVTKPFDVDSFMKALHAPTDRTLLEIERKLAALRHTGKPRQLDLNSVKEIINNIRAEESSYGSFFNIHKAEIFFGCSMLLAALAAAAFFARKFMRRRRIRQAAQDINAQQQQQENIPLNVRPIIR